LVATGVPNVITKDLRFASLAALILGRATLTGCTQPNGSGYTHPGVVEPWAPEGEPPKVSVRIPERYKRDMRLWIIEALPPDYAGKPRAGEPKRSELLVALWPGLEPRSETNKSEFERAGFGRRISILMAAVPTTSKPLSNYLTQVYEGSTTSARTYGEAANLSLLGTRHGLDLYDLSPEAMNRYLIKQFKISGRTYPSNQLFVKTDGTGTLATVISCVHEAVPDDRPLNAPWTEGPIFSECEHHFTFSELQARVSLTYSRKYLNEWAAIEAQVRNLLLSFIVKP
jgi:hypothetical protein